MVKTVGFPKQETGEWEKSPEAKNRVLIKLGFDSVRARAVTRRIKWNTPELHTAQPLDYLSHFTSLVTLLNTRYSG